MKQKNSDTLGMPEELVSKKRLSSFRQNRAGEARPPVFTPRIVLLIVAVLILAVLAWYLPSYLRKKEMGVIITKPSSRVAVPTTELPNGFPPDLPFIGSKTVLHNFVTNVKDIPSQGVRKWSVPAPAAEVFNAYEAYFKTYGWEIGTTLKSESKMLLAAAKGGKLISVSVQPGPEDNTSLIEVGIRAYEAKSSSN